ncbi:YciC family protein [Buchnera aphidicola]
MYIIMIDVNRFFYNNKIKIFIFSTISAFTNLFIEYICSVNINEFSILYNLDYSKKLSLFNIINNMSINQKNIIFYIECIKLISVTVSQFLLITSVIWLIPFISLPLIKKFTYIQKKIFKYFFLFILTIYLQYSLITLKFNFFIIIKIIFSIFLLTSIIFYIIEKKSIFYTLKISSRCVIHNTHLMIPIIFMSLIFKYLIFILLNLFNISAIHINIFILNIFINIYFSYIIIYLFRFYIFCKTKDTI